MKPWKVVVLSFSLVLMSCATQKPFYNSTFSHWLDDEPKASSELIYELFLIGDSRRAYESDQFVNMMESHLGNAGENSAVVFLGDNVQSRGLPDSTHRKWLTAKKSLDFHMSVLDNFKGEIVFIPGNHDWAKGSRDGLEYVKNQRKYIENSLERKNVFLPKKGRSGPDEIHLTDDIVLIIFDSQWWFHEHEKSYAGIVDETDIFIQIEDAVNRNRDKKIIFTTHHPLFSVGNHGGHFVAADNLFPLLNLNKSLYLPLPGFIYTGYRKFLGSSQDLANPHYKMLIEGLLEIFTGQSNIIYAAGHEHNLQYVMKDSLHHIISGAAGMSTYAAPSKKTDFAQMQKGLAKLGFYDNGDVWLEFFTASENLVFRTKLFNKPLYEEERIGQYLSEIDYSDSTVTTHPNGEKFQAGKVKRVLFGNNYREEWLIPVEVPVFDFNMEKGGLKVVKKGGGLQTKSLRLENQQGQQWVLRSLEKILQK